MTSNKYLENNQIFVNHKKYKYGETYSGEKLLWIYAH